MMLNEDLTERVIGFAIEVHWRLGPGLLESAYESCLGFELERAGIAFERQVAVPIVYRDVRLDAGFRADVLVAKELIVEVKAVEVIARVHGAQILTYLRLGGYRVGLLMNFNSLRLKDGLRRFVM